MAALTPTTAATLLAQFHNQADIDAMTDLINDSFMSVTTTERDALTGTDLFAGRCVYNSTTNKLNFYNGSAWEVVTSS